MTIRPFSVSVGLRTTRAKGSYSSQPDFVASIRAQLDVLENNYRDWVGHIDEESGAILADALQPTFDKSQDIVPVLTGELKNSGYLEVNRRKNGWTVEMGYARGGRPNYAEVVHEDLHAHHVAPEQAKFLEQPLNEDEEDIQERIRDGYLLAAGFKGGG